MTEKTGIYKCNVCGNIVEVLHAGGGTLACCGEPMEKIIEKTISDEGQEKHVPIVIKTQEGINIRVGSIEHPMLPEHYIEWIEISAEGFCSRKALSSGDKPELEFCVTGKIKARAYCNVHGLWKS